MLSTLNIKQQRGLSLIELMVAMVISLVAILVLMQVFTTTEARRRSVGGASAAQTTGNLSLFRIDQDVRLAGYGYSNSQALGCVVKFANTDVPGSATFTFNLQPVTINADATTGSDSIIVVHGSSELVPLRRELTGSTTTTKKISDRAGFQAGDVVVAVNRSTATPGCGLFEITDNSNTDGYSITHASATNYTTALGATKKSHFNPTDNYSIAFADASGQSNGEVYNLGQTPRANVFAVNTNRQLTLFDNISQSGGAVLADNVVSMKAQYGRDTDNDSIINTWDNTTPTSSAGWAQIRAIRVGVLVRSSEYQTEKLADGDVPVWSGSGTRPFVMKNLDGTAGTSDPANDTNWRNYRYRVYENVIPLINIYWGSGL